MKKPRRKKDWGRDQRCRW